MKYLNGDQILIGDEVDLGGAMTGLVVCCLDEKTSMGDYPYEYWKYLGTGVLVKFSESGLIHYPESDVDLVLMKRHTY